MKDVWGGRRGSTCRRMRALAVGTRWFATLETFKPKDLRNSRLHIDFPLCVNTPDFVARVAHPKSTPPPPTKTMATAKAKPKKQPAGCDDVESLRFVQTGSSCTRCTDLTSLRENFQWLEGHKIFKMNNLCLYGNLPSLLLTSPAKCRTFGRTGRQLWDWHKGRNVWR